MATPFVILALTVLAASPNHPGARPARMAAPRFEMTADSVVVPMHLETGHIMLDVRIDGRGPYPFILDTGAQGSVIDSAFAREMKLKQGKTTHVSGPGGRGFDAQFTTVDRLELGGLKVLNAPGAIMSRLPFGHGPDSPRGVLSPYRLGNLLITLDYPHGQMVFRRGSLPEPDGREVFGWDPNGELPHAQIDVAGRSYPCTSTVVLQAGSACRCRSRRRCRSRLR